MNSPDAYRKKAAEFESIARAEKDPAARIEWLNMARGYRRLAELAEKNALTDVVYEPPVPPVVQRQQQQQQLHAKSEDHFLQQQQQQQQQQQPQAKPEEDKT